MNEDNFILTAARINLSEQECSCLQELSRHNMDWSLIAEKARLHRVQQFLYFSLTKYGLKSLVPDDVFQTFQKSYFRTALRNGKVLNKLRIIDANAPCRIILLKGSDLLLNLYPAIGIRPMYDLDLLVEKENVQRFWNYLKETGFRENPNKAGFQYKIKYQYNGHLPELLSDYIHLELHWYLFDIDYVDNNFNDITVKSSAIDGTHNFNLYAFSNELKLIHLSIHFCLHLGQGYDLRSLCDINELILKNRDSLNWDRFHRICADLDVAAFVYPILTYAKILLKTPVPELALSPVILENASSITLDSLLAGRSQSLQSILDSYIQEHPESADKFFPQDRQNTYSRFFHQFCQLENITDKMIYLFRFFFPVKEYMDAKNYTHDGASMGLAYFRYWSTFLKRHLLKK